VSNLTGEMKADYVQNMFARIASRYDLMNRLITAGQDVRWRREVIALASLPPGGSLLDLGTGTGDLAIASKSGSPESRVVAADFTMEMMRVGQQRADAGGVRWTAADALRLPYASDSYDAVVSAFLMRNVVDIPATLREKYRVLKPGGRIVVLDTTRPAQNLLAPLVRLHLAYVIPALGRLVAGDAGAYTYLPETTAAFLSAEQLAIEMILAGFQEVGFRRRMFGTVAIHWGVK
jgi:demethylmenaquinone methyltransferase/2-methoxy-6-polyprenyl-1,4-benzoquinol methylase